MGLRGEDLETQGKYLEAWGEDLAAGIGKRRGFGFTSLLAPSLAPQQKNVRSLRVTFNDRKGSFCESEVHI